MNRHHDPAAVDAYLTELPAEQRQALTGIRHRIQHLVPGVTERISYAIPVFADESGDLVGLSAHSEHLTIHIMSREVADALRPELLPFRIHGAQALHFTPDDVPAEHLLTLIIDTKRAANLAR